MPRSYENAQQIPVHHYQSSEGPDNRSLFNYSYHSQSMKKAAHFDSLSPEEQRAVERDYYKVYDVNIGIRTAAALGGFITLFMLYLIYKTKCRAKKDYLSISETFPFDDFPSKEGRTSQDVSNMFSNSSSMKGSNMLINPPEGFQSPTSLCGSSQPTRTPRVSQSSYEGGSYNVICLGDIGATYDCSSGVAGTSSRDLQFRVISPTDSLNWHKYDDSRRSERFCQRLKPSRPQAYATNMLQEANINIQVIQPTPNITPRGSLRIDSPDSANEDDPNNLHMIIPLLTPLKSSRSSGQQGSATQHSSRRRSESPFLENIQHRVSFDGQSVGSDNVFLERNEECEMTSVSQRRDRKLSFERRKHSYKKRKSNEETYC